MLFIFYCIIANNINSNISVLSEVENYALLLNKTPNSLPHNVHTSFFCITANIDLWLDVSLAIVFDLTDCYAWCVTL